MHFVNRFLSKLGIGIVRASRYPPAFIKQYKRDLKTLRTSSLRRGFSITDEFFYDAGPHPKTYVDFECQFAAKHVSQLRPASILDIGSYRWFLIGMLCAFRVDTLEVREVESELQNEKVIVSDAKHLNILNDTYDVVTSLCAIEHFGLGRYGDTFDEEADMMAIGEMVRVLKPGGHLILSTTITKGAPVIIFNGHRVYNIKMIHDMLEGMELVEEQFFSQKLNTYCSHQELTNSAKEWDIYLGCWMKPVQ